MRAKQTLQSRPIFRFSGLLLLLTLFGFFVLLGTKVQTAEIKPPKNTNSKKFVSNINLETDFQFLPKNDFSQVNPLNTLIAPCGFVNPPISPSRMDCFTKLVDDDGSNVGTRIPVILIHGIHGNRVNGIDNPQTVTNDDYFRPLITFSNSPNSAFAQQYKIYRFHYKSDYLSVWEIAQSLRNRIDDLVKQNPQLEIKQIILIAHSMGGLVARSYMEEHDTDFGPTFKGRRAGEKVSKLITLATPHHGSVVANGNARTWGRNVSSVVFSAFDYVYWDRKSGCPDCRFDPAHANRGDLRFDNFNDLWRSNSAYLNAPIEKNGWLRNLNNTSRFNNRISAYYGYIGGGSAVQAVGQLGWVSLGEFIRISEGNNFNLQIATGVLITRIELNDFNSPEYFLNNDGLVSTNSAMFAQATVGKRFQCPEYNHEDMKDGRGGNCTQVGTSVRKPLFDFILDEFPISQPPPPQTRNLTTTPSASWTFGNITIGTSSQKTVVLQNTGNTTLTVTSISLSGANVDQFSLSGVPQGSFDISPNATRSFTINFSPTSVGSKNVNLVINNNSNNSSTKVISFSGSGAQAGCSLSLSSSGQSVSSSGGQGSFSISSGGVCSVSVISDSPWITVSQNSSTVSYSIASNTGGLRVGTIIVQAGNLIKTFTITQDGFVTSSCNYSLSGNYQSFGAGGGSNSFVVATQSNCLWSATSDSYWITINSTGLRVGTQSVSYTVSPNSVGSLRVGTIKVQDQNTTQVFTIAQDGTVNNCSYSLSSTEEDFPVNGGQRSFTITAGTGCQWQAAVTDNWITINSVNNGTGTRTLNYTIANNPSTTSRVGAITLQGYGQSLILNIRQNGQPVVYPDINLPVTSVNGGNALLNTTIYQSFVIQNTGAGYLSIGSIYLSSGSSEFELIPYSNFLLSGESTSLTVKFKPTSTGTKNATFSITSNDPDESPINFSVSGTGVTQLTGGIDFVWTNYFTLPTSFYDYNYATIANNIYAMGGFSNNYKYDPTINSWTQIASLSSSALDGAATTLNGKIYMVGSGDSPNSHLIKIYDPASNQWTTGAAIPTIRPWFTMASANGKVYAFGGGFSQGSSEVDEYDPASNTWTIKAPMPTARYGATAATVNNLIYVIGGYDGNQVRNEVEVYNPVTNTWAIRERMPTRRFYATSAVINNKIYVSGGNDTGGTRTNSVEEFDPSKTDSQIPGILNAWAIRNPLLTGRALASAGVVNSKLYVMGGLNTSGSSLASVEQGVLSASPKVSLPVNNADFGDVAVGLIGEKSLEIQNVGNALLTLSYSRISGSQDFTLFRSPGSLSGGTSAQIRIRIIPSSTGQKSATFSINTNDPSTPSTTFSVTANGVSFQPIPNGSWQVVNSLTLSGNFNPRFITVKDGKAYYSHSDRRLSVIDLASNTEQANIEFASFPSADPGHVAIAGNKAYVPLRNLGSNGQIGVINRDTNSVLNYIPIGVDPYAIASYNDRIYVSTVGLNPNPPIIKVLDTNTNSVVATIPVGDSSSYFITHIAVEPSLGRAYVVYSCPSCDTESGYVAVIDLATNTVTATIPIISYRPFRIAITGNRAYVNTDASVEVIDLSSNTVVSRIMIPNFSAEITATPQYVFVANDASPNNGVTVISTETNSVVQKVSLNGVQAIGSDPATNYVYMGTASPSPTFKTMRFIAPAFSVATNNQTLASSPGGNTTLTTTVSSIDGWTGPVTLSCEGLPTGGNCQFAQNPVNLPANGTVNTNVIINVPAGTVAGPYSFRIIGNGTGAGLLTTEPQTDFNNLALTVPTCEFQLASNQSIDFPNNGGNSSVAVNSTTGCSWTATSNVPWVTITSGGNGNGNGTVSYTVDPNSPEQIRTGTLTIAGQTYTIRQSGTPLLSVNDISVTEGNSGTVTANFTVSLSAASLQAATVNYETANGTATSPNDYIAISPTMLILSPGETSNSISVSVNGDTLDESNETFFINLTNPANATISDGQGQGTITDDDPPPSISISDVSQNEGNSGTTNFVFTISLSPVSGQDVSVNWTTANGTATSPSDYVSGNGSLSFAAGITSRQIVVSVNGDTTAEPNENFFVNLSAPINATISNGQGIGTIINDDLQPTTPKPFDFDGDGKTDIAVFRPTDGSWWILRSSNGTTFSTAFGTGTDKPVPGDFTGDGKTDIAVWRPSTGFWFVLRSEDLSYFSFPFGQTGDIPAPGDYDGDGKADPGVFRPSNATWFISLSGGGTLISQFGASNDKPVVADYDGDGKSDIAIWRANGANGAEWWISKSSGGTIALQFGSNTDKPVPGDYTGDGKADVAFFQPSTGFWYILRSEDYSYFAFPFGSSGDISAPGDFDGDGKFDPTVFRPSNTTWFVNRTTAGVLITNFGATGDIPVPSVFQP